VIGIFEGIVIALFATSQVQTSPGSTQIYLDLTLPLVLSALFAFGYYLVCEGAWGRTLGKVICGIRVVSEDRSKASFGQAALRTLLRIVDGIFAYLVGFIFMMTSDRRQRLGDRAAKTLVVRA
jgi:uncharacterized RDD family membrane protein YckC